VMFSFSLFFFYFTRSLHYRDLHSFPTRRSSDLIGDAAGCACYFVGIIGEIHFMPHFNRVPPKARARPIGRAVSRPTHRTIACARSEEHTSELQSPYDLVCRLLLEKKKKKSIRIC